MKLEDFPEYPRCGVCGSRHSPFRPHNALSPIYHEFFLKRFGREPSWLDAMAHCSPWTQQVYIRVLRRFDVDVESGDLVPKDPVFETQEVSHEEENEKRALP